MTLFPQMLPAGRCWLGLSTVPVQDAVKDPLLMLESRPIMGTPPGIRPGFEGWQVPVLVDEELPGHLCHHEVLGAVHVLAKTLRLSCSFSVLRLCGKVCWLGGKVCRFILAKFKKLTFRLNCCKVRAFQCPRPQAVWQSLPAPRQSLPQKADI